ncbi:MAG: gliding motility-associated C-terminal domain-containing protein [Bacteroidota bacterium]
MENNDIEDLFKKSFKNYEPEVRPTVWKNVRIGLKWGSLAVLINTFIQKIGISTVIAVVSSLTAIIGTMLVMNWSNADSKKQSETTTAPLINTVAEQPVNTSNSVSPAPLEESKNTTAPVADIAKETAKAPDNAGTSKKEQKKIESVINKFSDEPIAAISANPVSGTVPLIVDLSNTGNGKTNKWVFSDGKKANTEPNPVHVFEEAGIYTIALTSTNAEGKTAVDSIKVEVIGNSSISSIPKEFSPNGDGVLDVFAVKPKNISKMNTKIFDKKGTIVYKFEGTAAMWDGKDLQEKEAAEGIYFYMISAEGVDGKKYEQKGSINLTR